VQFPNRRCLANVPHGLRTNQFLDATAHAGGIIFLSRPRRHHKDVGAFSSRIKNDAGGADICVILNDITQQLP